MLEIILILILAGIAIYAVRKRNASTGVNTTIEEEDEGVIENPAACATCSPNKTVAKFNSFQKDIAVVQGGAGHHQHEVTKLQMPPMGAELDPNSPVTPKIRDSVGNISTVINQPDITNLYRRPWQDFYPTSGQTVFAPAIKPAWGLQNSWENAPVRACGRVPIPVRNQPCNGFVRQMGDLIYGKAQCNQQCNL